MSADNDLLKLMMGDFTANPQPVKKAAGTPGTKAAPGSKPNKPKVIEVNFYREQKDGYDGHVVRRDGVLLSTNQVRTKKIYAVDGTEIQVVGWMCEAYDDVFKSWYVISMADTMEDMVGQAKLNMASEFFRFASPLRVKEENKVEDYVINVFKERLELSKEEATREYQAYNEIRRRQGESSLMDILNRVRLTRNQSIRKGHAQHTHDNNYCQLCLEESKNARRAINGKISETKVEIENSASNQVPEDEMEALLNMSKGIFPTE